MNKLRDHFKNLDVGTFTEEGLKKDQPEEKANAMSGLIHKTGENLRTRIRELEDERHHNEQQGLTLIDIPIDAIDRPRVLMRSEYFWTTAQYRSIKDSIARSGLNDPITVRPGNKKGRYTLVKGDSRLHAFEELWVETDNDIWFTISARVQAVDDQVALMMMVSENRDRNDVAPIDLARFHTRICEEFLDGNREAARELLGVSESSLSKYIATSRLPDEILEAFPSLYSAGMRTLYPLARSIENNQQGLASVLKKAGDIQINDPSRQATLVQKALEGKEGCAGQRSNRKPVQDSHGDTIATVERTRKTTSVKFDHQKMPGFADFIEAQLPEFYARWLKEHKEKD